MKIFIFILFEISCFEIKIESFTFFVQEDGEESIYKKVNQPLQLITSEGNKK